MKTYFKALMLFILIFSCELFIPFQKTKAENVNLILNPSAEDSGSASTSPQYWQTDKWGTGNTTFNYQSPGYNSDHSLYVKMANRTSGDAKWYFDPVTVEPNTDYVFTDYYKSSVPTRIVVMSLDSLNKETYTEIGTVAAATTTEWVQVSYVIHTLANTKKLTVFHLISRNGWLQTDNFSLSKKDVTPVVDYIYNNSMEVVSPTNVKRPDGWTTSKWGQNTPVYEYLNNGHDGNRSVKITMTNYKTGDAKWIHTPVSLERGKDYRFTAWYKTNTTPHAVVQYIKDDGTESYFGMQDPVPNGTGWQQYTDVFSVPANVKEITVFMFLTSNGWLQTDDYHILPYVYSGFDRGRVTLTFDDGFEKNITSMLPVIDQYNFKVTNCYSTQYVQGLPKQVLNVQKFAANGNETCSHSVTHPDLTTLPLATVDMELANSQSYLKSIVNQPVTVFASPFGAYNSAVNGEIKKYYAAHRTTDEGFNSKDSFDPYRLRVQNMMASTTVEEFQSWVNKAKQDKTWLIVTYHVIGTTGLGEYDTNKADFDKEMAWLATSGVAVERLDKALSEVKVQLP